MVSENLSRDEVERRRPSRRACRRSPDGAAGRPGPCVSPSAEPLEQSLPKLAGWSGSPRTETVAVRGDLGQHAAAHPAIGAGRSSPRRASPFTMALIPPPAACRRARCEMRPSSTLTGIVLTAPSSAPERLAGLQRDHPIVQRAGHRGAVHDALAQRPALVRAVVLDGEDLVVGGAEDGDLALRRRHAARAAPRDVVDACRCRSRSIVAHSAACAKPADGHRPELVLVLAGDALRPGVDLGEFLARRRSGRNRPCAARDRRGPAA